VFEFFFFNEIKRKNNKKHVFFFAFREI
jgi:hypothetical protein